MTNQKLSIFFLIFFSTSLFSYNYFSPIIKTENFTVSEQNREFSLKHLNLIVNSEQVFHDSILLEKNEDYKIDYQNGKITFFVLVGNVSIEYLIFPEDLISRYFLFEEQTTSDSTEIRLKKKKKRQFYADTNLNITGSKSISVSIANNEDFSIDQSLFLKINGELGKNLRIEAQLSDSESPITPEGDSREISSLDQIFIKLYGKQYEVAFGDLEMEFKNTQFINYAPRFEGLKAGWFRENHYFGALAISKGKKTTVSFNGVEAKQGPYYLSIENTSGVLVVPGTEEVYLNGLKMQRGSDYTMDYAEGSITFTNKHFLTSNSFILVSFQYSDENFRQNMYLATSEINFFKKLKIRNFLAIQNDDKNNPLQYDFTDEDLDSLKTAGDEQAWGNGIFEVEAGTGLYVLEGNDFIYVGSDSTGNYNLHSTYVGYQNGDYNYNSDTRDYIYEGENLGNYVLKRKLIAPQNKANYDLNIDFSGDFYQLDVEGIFSVLDKNTFSALDQENDDGYAAHLGLNLFPDYDKINPNLRLFYRNISKNLSTFADIETPLDFYELAQFPDTLETKEYSANLSMNVFDYFSPNIKYKKKTAKDYAEQDYLALTSNFRQKWILPKIYYRFLNWTQNYEENPLILTKISKQEQHTLNGDYSYKKIKIGTDFFSKKRKTTEDYDNFRFGEKIRFLNYDISTLNTNRWSAMISYKREKIDSLNLEDHWKISRETQTVNFKNTLNFEDHRVRIDYSHREIKNDDKYDQAEITLRNSFWKDAVDPNTNYSLKNIEYYPKIRELEYIGEGLGLYDSTGVYTGDGDYDWIIKAIDYNNPEMSIEVNANFSLFLNPKAVTGSFWKKFQTETNLIITENSTADKKSNVYLLHPDFLMNEGTTIFGRTDFQQTLWYDFIPRKLTTKLRFQTEKNLDSRYIDEVEKNDQQTWEAMLRLLSVKRSNFELTYENISEQKSFYDSESRIHLLDFDVRNRLNPDLTLNSNLDLSRETTNKSGEDDDFEIDSIQLTETATYFFKRKYRVFGKFSYKRNFRKGSDYLSFLSDKKNGNIFKWNISLDYKMNSYTSASLEYAGDSYPERNDVHKIEVEVKAEF